MAISHESRLRVIDAWKHRDTDDISTVIDDTQFVFEMSLEDGNGSNQAQDMYRARRSIPSNDEDILDLAGSLVDKYGNTLTFATIKQITIVNLAGTAGENLLVGGGPGATGGALITDLFDGESDGRIKIQAGGVFLIATPLAGYTVTGGSADLLWIRNDGTDTIEYDIVIKGTRV
jgi:hypothetical protein